MSRIIRMEGVERSAPSIVLPVRRLFYHAIVFLMPGLECYLLASAEEAVLKR